MEEFRMKERRRRMNKRQKKENSEESGGQGSLKYSYFGSISLTTALHCA
jgi:hypothetical protein